MLNFFKSKTKPQPLTIRNVRKNRRNTRVGKPRNQPPKFA